ncbi:hypothetical protein D9619_009528 [Psilocybe cf. subviscida]|uniref:Nephrocystin 3-like N-terminal domain-containing protein n=1 Tax=Psilocybe cf. subviscida TaxID=2480587 RepID=A0A8H5BLT0_9AGAR|nr:hypothetical protein D9619_009528 [Psilocybe cf. subviscida]
MEQDAEGTYTSVLHANKVVIAGGTMTQSVSHVQQIQNHVHLRGSSRDDGFGDELVQLRGLVSHGAFYDSCKYAHFSRRNIAPAEKRIIQNAMAWSNEPANGRGARVLYVDIASGQTIVAQHIAELLERQNILLGSFFFHGQAHFQEAEHIFVATLAYQLTVSMPQTKRLILQVIRADPFIFTRDLRKQLQRLIIEPMSFALSSQRPDIKTGIFFEELSRR